MTMQHGVRLFLAAGVLLSLTIVAIQFLRAGADVPGVAGEGRLEQRHGEATAEVVDEFSARDTTGEELLKLLDDPRVQTYLQREQDKQALQTYFRDEGSTLSAEEIWRLIESIESEGRILAYEALALKLAWLERNSAGKTDFDASAQALVQSYRDKAGQKAADYDPYEKVPGFAEYKEVEKRIVREVQEMTSFPGGVTRQEYLRKRLQQAREAAYGS